MAGFIRLSAGIIQNYLTIKNEKSQSNEDRIEKDQILIKYCEEWVANAYLAVFKNIKSPKTQTDKQSILSAFSQIVAALYET